jgi:hypothetical protein
MTLPSLELMLIVGRGLVLTAALGAFAWMFRRWRSEVARDTQRVFEQLDLLRAELMLMQEQLSQLPRSQTVVTESRPAPEPRVATVVNAAAPRGYEVAARLARSGASTDELMSSCGLSRHEAALLLRLHGAEHQQTRSATSTAAQAPSSANKTVNTATGKNPSAADNNAKLAAQLSRKSRLSVVG